MSKSDDNKLHIVVGCIDYVCIIWSYHKPIAIMDRYIVLLYMHGAISGVYNITLNLSEI